MSRRLFTRWLVIAVPAVIGGTLIAVAGAAGSAAEAGSPIAPPTLKLVHPGRVPADPAGTFVSLIPACGCNHTVFGLFSLQNGRRLGTEAVIKAADSSGFQASDPHPGPPGSFDVAFSRGPLCTVPPGGGVSGGPCGARPNTCTSIVTRVNLPAGSVTTALRAPKTQTVTDAVPSPDGHQLALFGGPCRFGKRYLTVRNLATGRVATLGADAPRCAGIGPAAWSTDGRRLVFPYAPLIGRPPRNPQFCSSTRLPGLVIARADRTSTTRDWTLIRADHRCGFLYGVFDRAGIAAVEGCDYGQPQSFGGNPRLGDAFLLQLSGPKHRVTQRRALKLGFDGGGMSADPLTGTVLISESQAANNGVHTYNWVWTYAGGDLRLVHRYRQNDAPEVTAEPW